jgi:branched-subunit amino acid transport protein
MNEPLMILGMMLVTFLPRYGVLALLGRVEMPRPLFRALRFVPPAVLAAIILPSMLLKDAALDLTPQNSFLFAGIAAALVSWRSKNLLLTIVAGMVALLIWRAVFPAIQ